jgi:hypothetical protein
MLGRSDSMNLVTSCHQVESTVLNVPIGKAWEALKTFKFNELYPSIVKSVKFNSGSANEIGSEFSVEYADGSTWTFRISEISEHRRLITYELVTAEPEISFSSLQNTITLFKVTSDNSTFVQWESDYSNDVNAHVIQDAKFKKLDAFKDLKAVFANK